MDPELVEQVEMCMHEKDSWANEEGERKIENPREPCMECSLSEGTRLLEGSREVVMLATMMDLMCAPYYVYLYNRYPFTIHKYKDWEIGE